MALTTDNFNLFLPPKGNNAGDTGRPLNDNFVILDKILWDLRTNYANNPQTNIPIGAFAFNKVDEKLYIKVSAGLQVVADFGPTGGGMIIDKESLLSMLEGSITQDQLAFDLTTKLDLLDTNLIETTNAKTAAINASTAAIQAKNDAIAAANQAAGYKVDSYNSSVNAATQASNAEGYANTASTQASNAASSAGAAGISASAANQSKLDAKLYSDNAKASSDAAISAQNTVLSYKTAAETASQAASDSALTASINANSASGYANAALSSSQIASAKADLANQYAISAATASGLAQTAAGQAQTYSLSAAIASGAAISASQAAGISAQNASGFANQAQLYSVSASGYAQEAKQNAVLVASYLGAAEVSGYIGTEATVRAEADSALSDRIDQVSTTVGNNTTTIEEHTQSIDGIKGTYTVKIDNNGVLAGFGLVSEMLPSGQGTFSEFAIVADRFKLVKPGETPQDGRQIFLIDGQTGIVSIAANVLIGGTPASGVASKEDVAYRVELYSQNGLVTRKTSNPSEVLTTIKVAVYKGKEDITSQAILQPYRFRWTRRSPPPYDSDDAIWNSQHTTGYTEIPVTSNDIHIRATFNCEYLEEF